MKIWFMLLGLFLLLSPVFANNIELNCRYGEDGDRRLIGNFRFDLKGESAENIRLLSANQALLGDVLVEAKSEKGWFSPTPEAKVVVEDGFFVLKVTTAGRFTVSLNVLFNVMQKDAVQTVEFETMLAVSGNFSFAQKDLVLSNAIKNGEECWAWRGGKTKFSWRNSTVSAEERLISSTTFSELYISAGFLRWSSKVNIQIGSGEVDNLEFKIPAQWNITSVNIPWTFDRKSRVLTLKLGEKKQQSFSVDIVAERPLEALPASFELLPIVADGVIPRDHQLMIYTDPTLRFNRVSGHGIVQTEAGALAVKNRKNGSKFFQLQPEFEAKFQVGTIKPSFSEESRTTLRLRDGSVAVRYDATLEIRDAKLQELDLLYDPKLQFSRLISNQIAPQDYTALPDENGRKALRLKLNSIPPGSLRFSLLFESNHDNAKPLELNAIVLKNVQNCRGTLLVTADAGLQLSGEKLQNLTNIHASMLKISESGLLKSYLYRNQPWQISGKVVLEERHISGEQFSLLSTGEGNTYGFTLFTFNLSGAPINTLRFALSKSYENLEFSGADFIGTKLIGDAPEEGFQLWELTFKKRISGAVVLLASYEISRAKESSVPAGAIYCVGAEPENIFIAISGQQGMSSKQSIEAPDITPIDVVELPSEYRNIINNTILGLYRSTKPKSWTTVTIDAFTRVENLPLLIKSVDNKLKLDSNGDAISTVQVVVCNSSAQLLRAKLPPQSTLWSLKIGNKDQRASEANGELLIPLPRLERLNETLNVEITYAQKLGELAEVDSLKIPQIEFQDPILQRNITIELPATFEVIDTLPKQPNTSYGIQRGVGGVFGTRYMVWIIQFIIMICFAVAGTIWAIGFGKRVKSMAIFGIVLFGGGLILYLAIYHLLPSPILNANVAQMRTISFAESAILKPYTPDITLFFRNINSFYLGDAICLGIGAILAFGVGLYGRKSCRRIFEIGGFAIMISCILCGISQFLLGQAVVAFTLFAIAPVLLPLFYSIGLARKLRGAVIVLLFLGVLNMPAYGAEVSQYNFELTTVEENLNWRADYKLNLKAQESLKIFNANMMLLNRTLPEELEVKIDENGDGILYAQEDFEGDVTILVALETVKKGNEVTFEIFAPSSLSGVLSANLGKSRELKLTNAVVAPNREDFNIYAQGGTISGRITPVESKELEMHGAFNTKINFLRDYAEAVIDAKIAIPQGETSKISLALPPKMQIRQLTGVTINSWKITGENLDIFFNQPQKESVDFRLILIAPHEKLPQKFKYIAPLLLDATQQMSNVKLELANELYMQTSSSKEFSMTDTSGRSWSSSSRGELEFIITEKVPELQLNSQTELRYEDGRTMLNSFLTLKVTQGGIFQSELILPPDFEVIKLTGADIADWIERDDNGVRKIEIQFKNRVSNTTKIAIELARLNETLPKSEELPKVTFANLSKLSGTLSVVAERGTSLGIISRSAVSLTGDNATGNNALYFDLINPDWQLKLSFDSAPVWVQSEIFQKVKLGVNATECEATVKLKIENNSIKNLQVNLPRSATLPEFSGKYLTKSLPLGENSWLLEFDHRLEKSYTFKINYKLLSMTLEPISISSVASQSGYVAIVTDNALEFKEPKLAGEVSQLNPRLLPTEWQNQEAPIAAMRTVGTKWQAQLHANHNPNAKVNLLAIQKLNINSKLLENGVQFHTIYLEFNNIGETFLRFSLPNSSQLWGVTLNNIPAETVVASANNYMIPVANGNNQPLRLTFTSFGERPLDYGIGSITGLSFDAPLKNILWELEAPKGVELKYRAGSVEERQEILNFIPKSELEYRIYDAKTTSRKLSSLGQIKESNVVMLNAIQQTQNVATRNDLVGEMVLNNRKYNTRNLQSRQNMLLQNAQPINDNASQLAEVADKIFAQQQAIYAPPQNYDVSVAFTRGELKQFERAVEIRQNAPLELEYELISTYKIPLIKSSWIVFILLTLIGIVCVTPFVKKTYPNSSL